MTDTTRPKPNFLWSVFTLRCPRCRRGDLFRERNAYRSLKMSSILGMHEKCPVCGQKFDLEPGFWYGTGYVSYALVVLFSVITFVLWVLTVGISMDDNRVFGWLILNAVLILLLQPWLMRFSRAVYLNFFVHYDGDYDKGRGQTFDYWGDKEE